MDHNEEQPQLAQLNDPCSAYPVSFTQKKFTVKRASQTENPNVILPELIYAQLESRINLVMQEHLSAIGRDQELQKRQVNDLKTKVSANQHTMSDIINKFGKQQIQLHNLQSVSEEVAKLRRDFGEHGLHHDSLEAKLDHQLENLCNENNRCHEAIGKINRELASWHSETKTLQQVLDSFKDRYNEKLRQHSEALTSKLAKSEKLFQTECQKINKFYLDQSQSTEKLKSLQVHMSTLQSAMSQVQEDMAVVHKVSNFEHRISVLEATMLQTEAKIKANTSLISRVTDAVSQVECYKMAAEMCSSMLETVFTRNTEVRSKLAEWKITLASLNKPWAKFMESNQFASAKQKARILKETKTQGRRNSVPCRTLRKTQKRSSSLQHNKNELSVIKPLRKVNITQLSAFKTQIQEQLQTQNQDFSQQLQLVQAKVTLVEKAQAELDDVSDDSTFVIGNNDDQFSFADSDKSSSEDPQREDQVDYGSEKSTPKFKPKDKRHQKPATCVVANVDMKQYVKKKDLARCLTKVKKEYKILVKRAIALQQATRTEIENDIAQSGHEVELRIDSKLVLLKEDVMSQLKIESGSLADETKELADQIANSKSELQHSIRALSANNISLIALAKASMTEQIRDYIEAADRFTGKVEAVNKKFFKLRSDWVSTKLANEKERISLCLQQESVNRLVSNYQRIFACLVEAQKMYSLIEMKQLNQSADDDVTYRGVKLTKRALILAQQQIINQEFSRLSKDSMNLFYDDLDLILQQRGIKTLVESVQMSSPRDDQTTISHSVSKLKKSIKHHKVFTMSGQLHKAHQMHAEQAESFLNQDLYSQQSAKKLFGGNKHHEQSMQTEDAPSVRAQSHLRLDSLSKDVTPLTKSTRNFNTPLLSTSQQNPLQLRTLMGKLQHGVVGERSNPRVSVIQVDNNSPQHRDIGLQSPNETLYSRNFLEVVGHQSQLMRQLNTPSTVREL